jgi:hypothetical protein
MRLRYLIPTLLVLHAAEPPPLEEPISVDSVATYYNVNPDTDKVALFRALPESYRSGWIWMIDSSSEQSSACDQPRVILPGKNSRAIFAFSTVKDKQGKYTDPNAEMIAAAKSNTHFDFGFIHPGHNPPVQKNPRSCGGCHGERASRRPNWDTYDQWPGMLGFDRDRIYEGSAEEKAFIRMLETTADDPILGQLKLPRGVTRTASDDGHGHKTYKVTIDYDHTEPNPDPKAEPDYKTLHFGNRETERELEVALSNGKKIKVKQGGRYLLLGEPSSVEADEGNGSKFFSEVTAQNADRVVAQTTSASHFDRFKFALKAIVQGCVHTPADLAKYIPADEIAARKDFFKLGDKGFAELASQIFQNRRQLLQQKIDSQKRTLQRLIECNLLKEGKPVPKGIEMEELVTREFLRRNGSLSTYTTGIYPDHEKYETTPQLAQLIYLLKPEGVDTDRWSLASPRSASTSTFGDLLAAYTNRFKKALENLPARCDTLAVESLKAMRIQIAPMPRESAPENTRH